MVTERGMGNAIAKMINVNRNKLFANNSLNEGLRIMPKKRHIKRMKRLIRANDWREYWENWEKETCYGMYPSADELKKLFKNIEK